MAELITPQGDIYRRILGLGWDVGKVALSGGEYVARGRNRETGQDVERTGRTPEEAMLGVLTFAQRAAEVRRLAAVRRLGAWRQDWVHLKEEVAKAYRALPPFDSTAVPAWQALAQESAAQADVVRRQIDVDVTDDPEPYESAAELREDVTRKRRYTVSRSNTQHPVWSPQDVVNFRIVHDVLGLVQGGGDYSWRGENAAAVVHMPLVSELAQEALFVETVAQAAYLSNYRGYGPQKIGLLPQFTAPVRQQEGLHVWVPPVQSAGEGRQEAERRQREEDAQARAVYDREVTRDLPSSPTFALPTVSDGWEQKPAAPFRPRRAGGWARIEDGYQLGRATIHDNGKGVGPAKDSGRWAVSLDGEWKENVDTLPEAKAAAERLVAGREARVYDWADGGDDFEGGLTYGAAAADDLSPEAEEEHRLFVGDILAAAGTPLSDWRPVIPGRTAKDHDPGYERETERIKERAETPEARRAHDFEAAEWTHPNGHPRCRVCGSEEPVGGRCPGLSAEPNDHFGSRAGEAGWRVAMPVKRPTYVDTALEEITGPGEAHENPARLPEATHCPNPKCDYVLDADELAYAQEMAGFECPRCGGEFPMDPEETYTRAGLGLTQMGEIGEQVVYGLGAVPGLGTFEPAHTGGGDVWPIDAVLAGEDGARYGCEVKTNHSQAQERFKVGTRKARAEKIKYCNANGLQPALVGVRLNFYTDQADVFFRPGLTDTWIGNSQMRHVGTFDFSHLNPFRSPDQVAAADLPDQAEEGDAATEWYEDPAAAGWGRTR